MRFPWLVIIPLLGVLCYGQEADRWAGSVPRASRDSLIAGLRTLLRAESKGDWHTVYELRPDLDRETESEAEFKQRWTATVKGTVVDFAPARAVASVFGEDSDSEKVFDIQGCAKVGDGGTTRFQQGGISAHLDGGEWYLDGVHLMTDSGDHPEPCDFHPAHALLASEHGRRH